MTFTTTVKKISRFLFEENSIWSWLINILLIFLIVKFIIFPGASLVFGTKLPFVIIESGSMAHEGNFNQWFSLHGNWYLNNNYTKEQIQNWSWNGGLFKGDIIIVKGMKNHDYKIGDVIIFQAPGQGTPIIHRIVAIEEKSRLKTYHTKGDHNDGQLPYENSIGDEQIIGKAIGRIPWLGWVKLFFVGLIK
jgi:signal peptidase I